MKLSHDALIEEINKMIAEFGTQRAVAKIIGVTAQHINDLINGRRSPGDKLLKGMGLKKAEPMYEPDDSEPWWKYPINPDERLYPVSSENPLYQDIIDTIQK